MKKTCPTKLTWDEKNSANYLLNKEILADFQKTVVMFRKRMEEKKKEVESMKRGIEKEVKENCWLCHEQLPYRNYNSPLRDVDGRISGLESQTILVKDQCLELLLELMYNKEGKKDKPVVFEICKKYVHKECGEKVVRQDTLDRCIGFALIGEPRTFSPYGSSPRTDAYLNIRVILSQK